MTISTYKRFLYAWWIIAIAILGGGAWLKAKAQTVPTPPITAMACAYNITAPAGVDKTFQLVQCGPTGGFVVAPFRGNPTDASGTIASTGVYQTVMAANSSRNTCSLQNNGSNNMSVRINSATIFNLSPSQSLSCSNGNTVVISLIEITGTAGDIFAANYL